MQVMHKAPYHELLADRGQLSVARTLPIPLMSAIAAVAEASLPELHFEGHWRRDATGPLGRSDLAAARVPARLAARRSTAVELELAPWSDHECELVVRPAGRAPHRWSARRRARWYADAHALADALRQQLLATPHARRMVPMQVAARTRLAG